MSWAGDDTLPIGDNDSSLDDIEDIIPTSQPKSATSFESSNSRRIEETIPEEEEELSAIIDDTIPVFGNKTPVLDPSPGYIPNTETRPKRKFNESEFLELASKKLLSNTTEVKDSEDIFSTQPFTVPDSPSIIDSQLQSVVNETASQIDTQTCVNLTSNNNSSNDILMSDTSITEIFLNDVSKDTIDIDSTKSSKTKSTDNSILEIKMSANDSDYKVTTDEIIMTESPLRFMENSATLPVLNTQQLEEELPKLEDKNPERPGTNDTIDANGVDYPPVSPFSKRSVEDLATMSTIPSIPVSVTSSSSGSENVQQKKNFVPTRALLKKVLSNGSPELQKHSTPENPMSKPLDIDESASSIENVTPDAGSNSREGNKYTVSFNFKLICEVEIDPETKTVNKKTLKKIINLDKPKTVPSSARYIEPLSTSSDEKSKNRLSSSSSGSVFSDKANLPFKLPNHRLSSQTESSGSVDELRNHIRIESRTFWANEYLIPMEMDEALNSRINEVLNEKNESADSLKRKTPVSSKKPKSRRKIHQQTLPDVSESTNTEDFLSGLENHMTDPSNGAADAAEAEAPASPRVEEKIKTAESSSKNEAEATSEENVEKEVELEDTEKEEIPEENTTPEKENDLNVETFSSGLAVFARWTDLRYYSGVLLESAKYDRWNVKFDDGTSKAIKEEFIIPTQWLKEGELVFALVNDNYEQGRIKNIKKKDDEFTIELDSTNEDIVVKKSDLCLTENQVGIVKEKFPPLSKATPGPKADIDLDNVLSGKRIREPRTPIRNISLVSESTSSKKRSATKPKAVTSESDTPVTKQASNSAKKTRTPVEIRSTRRRGTKSESSTKNETPENITPVKSTGKSKAKTKSLLKDFDASTSSPLATVLEEAIPGPSGIQKISEKPTPGSSKASTVPEEPTPGTSGVKRGRKKKTSEVAEETKPVEKNLEVEDAKVQKTVPENRKGKRKIKSAEFEVQTDEEAPKKSKTTKPKRKR